MSLIAYTSVLQADRSPLGRAEDHRQTEALLVASGVPHVLLRNGWYSETYMAGLPAALAHGALLGALGSAEAQADRTYELVGAQAYTLSELAAEMSRQTSLFHSLGFDPQQLVTYVLCTLLAPAVIIACVSGAA